MPEFHADEQAIREVVAFYIDGIHNGNVDLLKKAFHPKAMMYGSSPNSTTIIEIEGLYGCCNQRSPFQNRRASSMLYRLRTTSRKCSVSRNEGKIDFRA